MGGIATASYGLKRRALCNFPKSYELRTCSVEELALPMGKLHADKEPVWWLYAGRMSLHCIQRLPMRYLIHLPLGKTIAISQTKFSNAFSRMKSFVFPFNVTDFFPNGPIDNYSVLFKVMAWRRTGDKPLPQPLLTQFTDVYMWH